VKNQVVSYGLALVCGVLGLAYVFAATGLQWMISYSIGWIPSKELAHAISNTILEFASIPLGVTIFLLFYYFLPNGEVPISRVLPAAVVTGIVTEAAKFVYIKTLPMFRFREVYGQFALSVTLLFWAYVGALILLFGAHLSATGLARAAARDDLDSSEAA
jgi:uncharacterized BrkB/YihY/UPF0761 family membrane protein